MWVIEWSAKTKIFSRQIMSTDRNKALYSDEYRTGIIHIAGPTRVSKAVPREFFQGEGHLWRYNTPKSTLKAGLKTLKALKVP